MLKFKFFTMIDVEGPSYSPVELKPIIEKQLKGKENL